jgi:hypothetical protein
MMDTMSYHGIVKNGAVVFDPSAGLIPDGTPVLVLPLPAAMNTGDPASILAAALAEPHLLPEDVDALDHAIEAGRRQRSQTEPL